MKFVIVKVDSEGVRHLCFVPKDRYLYFGDRVLVQTVKNGVQTGVCACDSFAVDDKDVEKACTMYGENPDTLYPVIGTVYYQYWDTDGEKNG